MKTYGPLVLQKENKVATNLLRVCKFSVPVFSRVLSKNGFYCGEEKGKHPSTTPFQNLNSGQQTFLHPNKFMVAVNM